MAFIHRLIYDVSPFITVRLMVKQRLFCYLDCLILQRMVGIVHVLQRDAVELALVDVRNAVVFTSLG